MNKHHLRIPRHTAGLLSVGLILASLASMPATGAWADEPTATGDTPTSVTVEGDSATYSASMLKDVTATDDGVPIEGFDPTENGGWTVSDLNKLRIQGIPDGWTTGMVNEPVTCDRITHECTGGEKYARITVYSPDKLTHRTWTFTLKTDQTDTDTGKDAGKGDGDQTTPPADAGQDATGKTDTETKTGDETNHDTESTPIQLVTNPAAAVDGAALAQTGSPVAVAAGLTVLLVTLAAVCYWGARHAFHRAVSARDVEVDAEPDDGPAAE